jgi:hypothetical protein
MPLTARRLAGWSFVVLAIFLVVAQFVPLNRTNPLADPQADIAARLSPPAPVAAAFDRSCRDCHTNKTRWPWYSRVAPISWVVVDDVNSGRRHLNLSEWATYDTHKAAEKLGDICDEVKSGDMPDFKYTLIHREARLSPAEVQAICGWTAATRSRLLASSR